MRIISIPTFIITLLLTSCIDKASNDVSNIQDKDTLDVIIKNAVYYSAIQVRQELLYTPNTTKPFNGWIKFPHTRANKILFDLLQVEEGRVQRFAKWQSNGLINIDISLNQISRDNVCREFLDMLEGDVGGYWDITELEAYGGSLAEEFSDHMRLHGPCFIWFKDGKIQEKSNYKNGTLDGYYCRYYENGQIRSELKYKNGTLDGLQTEWYDNGQINTETNFINGNIDGVQCFWYKNGQVGSKGIYKNGLLTSAVAYLPNGELCKVTKVSNGDGVMAFYYENSKLANEYAYKLGKPHGIWKIYYQDGGLYSESAYIMGVKNGIEKVFKQDGTLSYTATYEDGEIVTKDSNDQ